MKCAEIKQDLAFVAEGSLDSTRARLIREHCAQCASCQALSQEYQKVVSAHLATVNELNLLTLSKPMARIRASKPVQTSMPGLWKWLVPVAAVSCIVLFIVNTTRQHKNPLVVITTANPPVQNQNQKPPSLLVYRNILETSGDEGFDRALNRDALRLLPPTATSSLADLRNDRL
ncbi:MAG: hypothetical protein JWN25_101 [Verrucomicrobiales bacterium]|nr:hypothetical protein [Verrucomicrobiales bacterium]